jgi:hypothetical protein
MSLILIVRQLMYIQFFKVWVVEKENEIRFHLYQRKHVKMFRENTDFSMFGYPPKIAILFVLKM